MGHVDGVPMVYYGQGIAVAASSTVYAILYPVPDYVGDQEFLYEDDVMQDLFLHRISGEIHAVWSQGDGGGTIGWSLMALGVEYDTVSVLEPFSVPWHYNVSEWANLPFWAKRVYRLENTVSSQPDVVDHPWWTHVDIKPGRRLGVRQNLWPVLAMRNSDPAQECVFSHTLKAWYS